MPSWFVGIDAQTMPRAGGRSVGGDGQRSAGMSRRHAPALRVRPSVTSRPPLQSDTRAARRLPTSCRPSVPASAEFQNTGPPMTWPPFTGILCDDLRVVGDLVPEVVAVEQVEHAFLAAAEQQVRSGQQREAGSAQVVVGGVERRFVAGREVVEQGAGRVRLTANFSSESPKLRVPSHMPLPVAK